MLRQATFLFTFLREQRLTKSFSLLAKLLILQLYYYSDLELNELRISLPQRKQQRIVHPIVVKHNMLCNVPTRLIIVTQSNSF